MWEGIQGVTESKSFGVYKQQLDRKYYKTVHLQQHQQHEDKAARSKLNNKGVFSVKKSF